MCCVCACECVSARACVRAGGRAGGRESVCTVVAGFFTEMSTTEVNVVKYLKCMQILFYSKTKKKIPLFSLQQI